MYICLGKLTKHTLYVLAAFEGSWAHVKHMQCTCMGVVLHSRQSANLELSCLIHINKVYTVHCCTYFFSFLLHTLNNLLHFPGIQLSSCGSVSILPSEWIWQVGLYGQGPKVKMCGGGRGGSKSIIIIHMYIHVQALPPCVQCTV